MARGPLVPTSLEDAGVRGPALRILQRAVAEQVLDDAAFDDLLQAASPRTLTQAIRYMVPNLMKPVSDSDTDATGDSAADPGVGSGVGPAVAAAVVAPTAAAVVAPAAAPLVAPVVAPVAAPVDVLNAAEASEGPDLSDDDGFVPPNPKVPEHPHPPVPAGWGPGQSGFSA